MQTCKAFTVLDNITAGKDIDFPKHVSFGEGRVFDWNGLVYVPRFNKFGEVYRYEADLNNLKIFLSANSIRVNNSIHKFYKGNNHSDFNLKEIYNSIETISQQTGLNWWDASIRKIEYGCNVITEANNVSKNLLTYRGKDFHPCCLMVSNTALIAISTIIKLNAMIRALK